MANSGPGNSVAKATGLAFLGILIALILSSALDTFFGVARSITDVEQIWIRLRTDTSSTSKIEF
jgi:hypothetical protein